MKNNINIRTLSQIHVGSGVFLQKDNDFIIVDSNGISDIYIIDPDKLGRIIGTDKATIDNWVTCIERGKAADFIRQRTQNHKPSEFALRRITNFANFSQYQGTLKECLHDGMGRPYIPGSSIKGAIRTAVLATLERRKGKAGVQRDMMDALSEKDKKYREKEFAKIEGGVLGKNPNIDIFRFLSVSDAFFEKGSEIAVRQINLNITQKEKLKDQSKQQVVEAIGTDEKSSCNIKIDKNRYDLSAKSGHADMMGLPAFPEEMRDIKQLFALINQHTKLLVKDEIEQWNDLDNYSDQSDYVANMEDILETINYCNDNECVLRLGQAIGWRFITGAWTEILDEDTFNDKIVSIARPRNERYADYTFPKSRRIDDESYLFGFIKLTLNQK